MTLKPLLTSALTLAAVLALSTVPAAADSRDRDSRDHSDHARARVDSARSSQSRDSGAERSRPADTRGYAVPRTERVAPRVVEPARRDERSYVAPRGYSAPRAYAAPRSYSAPRYYEAPRYYSAPRYYEAPRYYSAPRIFEPRPYRSGLSFSFGIFFGRPFPYRWGYPVYVPVPYGYPAYTIPAGVPYGGISFGGMTPYDASVFVDGNYVGVASTFDGTRQPLTLTAGRHRIELQAPGYEPVAFDVDVPPGQVIPYQGGLPSAPYGY